MDDYNLNEADFILRESISNLKGLIEGLYFGFYDEDEEEKDALIKKIKEGVDNLYLILNTSILEKAKKINFLLNETEKEREQSEKLLLNILPKEIAEELKKYNGSIPRKFEKVTILFTDFVGFTKIAEKWKPQKLIIELDKFFEQFDNICYKYNLEKLKTIGDSYMAAGGIPVPNDSNPVDVCLFALEIRNFMEMNKNIKKSINKEFWEIRIGINTGMVMSGVVGKHKFQYDIWGDAVNLASRLESSGTPGKINISKITYELVKDFFTCEYRGKIKAKNKGELDMYYLTGIKPELSVDFKKIVPNELFKEKYKQKFRKEMLFKNNN